MFLKKGIHIASFGGAVGFGWLLGRSELLKKDWLENAQTTVISNMPGLPIYGTVSASTLAVQDKSLVSIGILGCVPEPNPKSSRIIQIMRFGFPSLSNVRSLNDYVLSYDTRNRVPYWTFEHLTKETVASNDKVDRAKCEFTSDTSFHEFFRSSNRDYKGSGFDRGHLAAAGNHKRTQEDCEQSFLLSNMCPQVGKGFNRDKWNDLESYCRKLTRTFKNVYICTGPLYLPRRENDGNLYVKYQVLGQNHVAVPTHFFKIIVCEVPSGELEMESFILPNTVIDNKTPIETFHVPAEVIERASGLLFFDKIHKENFKKINGKKVGL